MANGGGKFKKTYPARPPKSATGPSPYRHSFGGGDPHRSQNEKDTIKMQRHGYPPR